MSKPNQAARAVDGLLYRLIHPGYLSIFERGKGYTYPVDEFKAALLKVLSEGRPEKLPKNPKYDGDNLQEACNAYGCAFESWAEVIRFEQGFNQGIAEYTNVIKSALGGEGND